MTNCKKCWWYGKPIECPDNFNIDTKECKNFKPKQDSPTEKGETERQIQTAKTMIKKMVSCYDQTEKDGEW